MRSGFIPEITGKFTIKIVERLIKTCKTKKKKKWKLNASNHTNKQIEKHHYGGKLLLAPFVEQKLSPGTKVMWAPMKSVGSYKHC
jgi:hypothetical protein